MNKIWLGAAAALCALGASADFSYRSELTVAGYSGTTAVENFPVLVRLSNNAPQGFNYALVNANGYDLKFTDESGEVVYPHQIDTWNPEGESLIWVKIPSLEAGTKFLMYFGDVSINEPPASQNDGSVWTGAASANADYVGVWHLDEASGVSKDSTVGGIGDATPTRSSDGKESTVMVGAAGKIGICRSSPSTEKHYLSMNSYQSLGVGTSFTFSGWYYQTVQIGTGAGSGYCRLVARSGNNKFDDWELQSNNSDTSFNYTGASGDISAKKSLTASPTPSIRNHWRHFVVVADGTSAAIYVDGVCQASTTDTFAPADGNNKFAIGCSSDGAQGGYFAGYYDEIRLRRGAVSAEWAKAEFDTVDNADFLTYGAAEPLFSGNYLDVAAVGPACGSPIPAYGRKDGLSKGDTVTCTAPDWVLDGNKRGFATGYVVSNVLASGEFVFAYDGPGNTFEYTQGDNNAVLYWTWDREYKVSVAYDSDAVSVTQSSDDCWYDEGSTATLAVANVNGRFAGWNGDLDSPVQQGDRTITLTMDAPKSLSVHAVNPWVYDNTANPKVLYNDEWNFTVVETTVAVGDDSVTGLQLKSCTRGAAVCNLTDVKADIGLGVVSANGAVFSGNADVKESLTVFMGPDFVDAGTSLFSGCAKLLSATFSPNLVCIGESAFDGCNSLVRFQPMNCLELTTLGKKAFRNCSALTGAEWHFPKLTILPTYAFVYCSNLRAKMYFDNLTTLQGDGNTTPFYDAAIYELYLPKVTSVPNSEFYGNKSIKKVTFGSALTEIVSRSFRSSTLEEIAAEDPEIGLSGLLTIGGSTSEGAFRDCAALVKLPKMPMLHTVSDGAFSGCTTLSKFEVPSVTNIGASAFYNCGALASVQVSEDLRRLGASAFENCKTLVTFTPTVLPSLTTIGSKIFNGCSVLVGDWEFPNYSNAIEQYLFDSTAVTSVKFPRVTQIKDRFVYNCKSLKNCWVGGTPTDPSFTGIWLEGITSVLGSQWFNTCQAIKNMYVDLPITLTIGSNGCYNMISLTNIVFKSVVNFNGQNAFRDFAKGATVEFWSPTYPTFDGSDCFGRFNDTSPSFARVIVKNAAALDGWKSHLVDLEAQLTTWGKKTDAQKKPYYDDMPQGALGLVRPLTAGNANSGWCWLLDGTPPAGTVLMVM